MRHFNGQCFTLRSVSLHQLSSHEPHFSDPPLILTVYQAAAVTEEEQIKHNNEHCHISETTTVHFTQPLSLTVIITLLQLAGKVSQMYLPMFLSYSPEMSPETLRHVEL